MADFAVRAWVRRVVLDSLRSEFGADAVVDERIPGLLSTQQVPADARAGIAMAQRVTAVARELIREWARSARGAGMSWSELADSLGVAQATDRDPAELAFELVAGEPPASAPWATTTVSWRCGSCGQHISDRGPCNGNPVDCEFGHADDCARHLHDLAVYEARWGDEW